MTLRYRVPWSCVLPGHGDCIVLATAYRLVMHSVPLSGLLTVRAIDVDDQRVAGPFSTDWRSLPCLVFNQWLGGDLDLDLDSKQGLKVHSGYGILLPSGCRHNLTLSGQDLHCRWVHLLALLHGSVDVFSLVQPPLILKPEAADRLGDYCASLAAIRFVRGLAIEARRIELSAAILAEVLGHCDGSVIDAVITRLEPLLCVLVWVRTNLHRPITRTDLAHVAGLSSTRFHYVFKQVFGLAPMAWLRLLRMQEAQRLLVEGNLGVRAVALSCGFADPFHFSRQFKATCGCPPLAYRRAYRDSLRSGSITPPR